MKKWMIIALVLLLLGLMLLVVTMSLNGWNFRALSPGKLNEQTHTVTETFSDIQIDISTADLRILPSEDGSCRVVCREHEKVTHFVKVENDSLVITEQNERKWYDYIGLYFETPKVTLYLPEEAYGALNVESNTGEVFISSAFTLKEVRVSVSTGEIQCRASVEGDMTLKSSTGDIKLTDIRVGTLKISLSTGDIRLISLACDELTVSGGTGGVKMEDVVVSGKMTVKNGTGDVEFEGCDAKTTDIRTSTGDIEGSFLSGKMFDAKTSTGDIDLPANDRNGGDCYLKTSTGDIEIRIE